MRAPATRRNFCRHDVVAMAVCRHVFSRGLARPAGTASCKMQVGRFVSPATTSVQYAVRMRERWGRQTVTSFPRFFFFFRKSTRAVISCQSTVGRRRVGRLKRLCPCLTLCTTRPRSCRRWPHMSGHAATSRHRVRAFGLGPHVTPWT